jgi:hypothetical protein
MTMNWHIVYARYDGCKSFKAFDINEGRQVGNLIYASLVENTEDTRQKLQKLADLNKGSPCAPTSQERQSVLSDKVKGNGQTNHLPTIFLLMDTADKDIKREQIKALMEKMKQEGKAH